MSKRRLYKFVVELLDSPDLPDDEFTMEVAHHLADYFEAERVKVQLVESADYLGFDIDDKEIAQA